LAKAAENRKPKPGRGLLNLFSIHFLKGRATRVCRLLFNMHFALITNQKKNLIAPELAIKMKLSAGRGAFRGGKGGSMSVGRTPVPGF